jgi:hypothetical protein
MLVRWLVRPLVRPSVGPHITLKPGYVAIASRRREGKRKSADVKNWLRQNCFAPGNGCPFLFNGTIVKIGRLPFLGDPLTFRGDTKDAAWQNKIRQIGKRGNK